MRLRRGRLGDDLIERPPGHEPHGVEGLAVEESGLVVASLSDELRADARETLDAFTKAGIRLKIISGDNPRTVAALAAQVGFDGSASAISGSELDLLDEQGFSRAAEENVIFGRITPDQKERLVDALRKRGAYVAMVGDGVNDAPALALSDVGIAMGSKGTDIALETADMVLMSDRIELIPDVIRLGQRTLGTVKVNIALAVGSKLIFVVLAVLGMAHLGVAIATDTGVAILVILNGLRLFK